MKTLNTIEQVQTLTNEVLYDLIANVGSKTISLEYIVDDRRSKIKNKQNLVQKHVKCNNVYLHHDYGNKVKKLSGDTTFVPQPLKGKERITPTILKSLVTNELLIDGKILYSETTKILGYFHNNKPITEAEALGNEFWGNSYFKVPEKKTMGRGIVPEENDFYIINTTFDKIVYIKINGIEYRR